MFLAQSAGAVEYTNCTSEEVQESLGHNTKIM